MVLTHEPLTLESLPKSVALLREEIADIKQFLLSGQPRDICQPDDDIITIHPAAKLTHLAVPTMYAKVANNELPYMRKGRRLYFSRKELIGWMQSGRNRTREEIIEADAAAYVANKKRLR